MRTRRWPWSTKEFADDLGGISGKVDVLIKVGAPVVGDTVGNGDKVGAALVSVDCFIFVGLSDGGSVALLGAAVGLSEGL